MTTRDYVVLATAINTHFWPDDQERKMFVEHLMPFLEADNSRFNKDKFREATNTANITVD